MSASRSREARGLQGRLARLLSAEGEHPLDPSTAAALRILELVYEGLYMIDRLPYRLGLRRPIHPGVPAIGLGNLAVGGTGKTPCAIWLANALKLAGRRPVLVSHGYRGDQGAPLVVSNGVPGQTMPPAAGDEAMLAAVSCPGVPVVSGRNRIAAAHLAGERFAPDVLIFDDVFQHWRLARDLDLVLLDAARPFGNGRLLPRGWLREPATALSRADGLILVGNGGEATYRLPPLPVFHGAVLPVAYTPWKEWRRGERWPLGEERGPVAAFCGLARPERFYAMLRDLGWTVEDRLDLPDHELPGYDGLREWSGKSQCSVIITTEKDAIKFHPELIRALSGRELWVLSVAFLPPAGEGLLAFVLDGLAEAERRITSSSYRS